MNRIFFAAACLFAVAGCEHTVATEGTVNRGGHPLNEGYVAFDPVLKSGTTGPGTTVVVSNGKFKITASEKLTAGKYIVRVGPKPTGASGEKPIRDSFAPWQTMLELKNDGTPIQLNVPAK